MQTRFFTVVLVLAALVRVGLLLAAWNDPDRLAEPDSRGYIELSDRLAQEGDFRSEDRPEIFRTPGYPLFLAFGLFFGESWWRAVALLQIILDTTAVYLTFLLGMMLWGERAGLWAAAFQALTVVSMVASVRILGDSLFAFGLLLAVLLLVYHFRTGELWAVLAAGGASGAATYVRPAGLLLCGLATLVLLLRARRVRRAGAYAGVVLVMLLPWVVRNGLVADYWGFSSVGAEAAYLYQGPAVLVETRRMTLGEARRAVRRSLLEKVDPNTATPGELAAAKREAGWEPVREHPGVYLAQHARGNLAVWMPAAGELLELLGVAPHTGGTLAVWASEGPAAAVRHYLRGRTWVLWVVLPLLVLLGGKYVLLAVGLIRGVRLRMDATGWLMLLVVLAFVLVPGPAGHPRFRVAVAPLLSVWAGVGMACLLDRLLGPRQVRPTITAD